MGNDDDGDDGDDDDGGAAMLMMKLVIMIISGFLALSRAREGVVRFPNTRGSGNLTREGGTELW